MSTIWESTGKPLKGFGAGKYRLTPEYLFFETGGLSVKAQQIPTAHITDVDMKQSMTQKARSVGTLYVHVTRPNGQSETAEIVDIPNFREGVEAINAVAAQARAMFVREQKTQHVNYGGGQPAMPPQSGSAHSLKQLADAHSRGAVGHDEFMREAHRLIAAL